MYETDLRGQPGVFLSHPQDMHGAKHNQGGENPWISGKNNSLQRQY